MHITPRLLSLLVKIADRGSLTKAADSLNLTQSALSQGLKQLETTVDEKLVNRNRHGAEVTEIGGRIVRYGRIIDRMIDRAREDVLDWKAGRSGRLAIGVTPLTASIVPLVLSAFLTERPKLSVRLHESSLPGLITAIEKGDVDVAVGAIGMVETPEGLNTHHLYDDHLCIMAGKNHPLTKKAKIERADLEAANWIDHHAGTAMSTHTRSVLAVNGFTGMRTQIELWSVSSIVSFLLSDQYVTLLPKTLLRFGIAGSGIRTLDFPLEGTRWPMGFVYRTEYAMPNLIMDFAAMLRSSFGEGQAETRRSQVQNQGSTRLGGA